MNHRQIAFAVPGDLATATGGYGYDRRIMQGLSELGWDVKHIALGDGFPWPDAQTLEQAQQVLLALPAGHPIVIDGLAFGVMPEVARALAQTHPLVALVHHPLALENGLSEAQRQQLHASEKAALVFAGKVIVTSPSTAALMPDFDVEPSRVVSILPGTEISAAVDSPAQSGQTGGDNKLVRLLSVGTITPRKGFDVLIAALAQIKNLPWHLNIVGDIERDVACAQALRQDILRFGLTERLSLLGSLSEAALASQYQASDVFVLASRFEGYGMAYAEAMAYGLPIVGTTGGAIPETVPAQAGILVAPDELAPLAKALALMVTDTEKRKIFALGARQAATALPTWQQSAQAFERVLLDCVNHY